MRKGWEVMEVVEWEGEPPIQVVPEVEWPGVLHILDDECWCRPYRDSNHSILIHREEAQA